MALLILTVLAVLGAANAVATGWLIDLPETTTPLRELLRFLAWLLLEQKTTEATP